MLILGVTGSIAAYKSADLASKLCQSGIAVQVIMTRRAREFVAPLTFHAITHQSVLTDEDSFDEPMAHIDLTDKAQLFVVAPASANSLAKFAHGLADDVLSTTALSVKCPLWLVPAMNTRMWEHPATQKNIETLKLRGVKVLDPDSGSLACGHTGAGRMQEPNDLLLEIQKSNLF